jgi:hypothetical protein
MIPKRRRDARVMSQGVSDETKVVIKRAADENAVTYLRVKLLDERQDVKGEGWNTLASRRNSDLKTVVLRHGKKNSEQAKAA